jgi:hypothetical protein
VVLAQEREALLNREMELLDLLDEKVRGVGGPDF